MLTLEKFKFIKRENERKKLSFYERMKILRHKQGLLPIKKIITKCDSCRLNINSFEMTNAQEIIPGLFVCGEGALSTLSNNFDLAMAKESLFALDSFIKTLYHGHNGYPTTANISTLNCSLLN